MPAGITPIALALVMDLPLVKGTGGIYRPIQIGGGTVFPCRELGEARPRKLENMVLSR